MEKEILFGSFDTFFIAQMGYSMCGTTQEQEKIRREAYHTFLQKIQGERPASFPTIRRWFGIHSVVVPAREQIFHIAFCLGLDVETVDHYLMAGIRQPSFQINDYTEMIAMYGLENKWDWEKYQQAVEEYEKGLDEDIEILHEPNTQWLFHQFEYVKALDEEQFMYWMWDHSGIFKGYSKTAQEYLTKYRELVLAGMRNEAETNLRFLLAESGFQTWKKKRIHWKSANELEQIKKYLRFNEHSKNRDISEHLAKNILELAKMAYSETGQNTKLLSELFEASHITMTHKYLSDLFHIPERNEMHIRTRQAIRKLENCSEAEACPQEIAELIDQFGKGKVEIRSAGEAKEWLEEFDSEGRRRRLIVKRSDLLPMICYVAQQQYRVKLADALENYNQSEAQKLFLDMANAVLIACNMPAIDEKYSYDRQLLQSFQEEEE